MSSQDEGMTRRKFIQGVTAAAVAAPMIVPETVFGQGGKDAPSERVTIGIIGCGKMAKDYHFSELLRFPDVEILAVCDVDTNRREAAKKRVEDTYSQAGRQYKGCDAYNDFRDIIKRKDIDAVLIATPEHWHTIPIVEACKAGKDVYCEKPLTLTLAESKLVIDAVRKYKRVLQVGSQQRSNVFGPFREAAEFIRSGRLGKISRITVGVGGPPVWCDLPEEVAEPGLDWDMWLGPAPMRPYNSVLSPRGVHDHFPNWRSYREYAGGGHADFGAHHYDIAQWAMDLDNTSPVEVIAPADPKQGHGAKFIYASGLEIEHGGPGGCTFFGEKGTLHIDRGVLESTPEDIVKEPLGENEVHLYQSPGHHRNWLDCIKSRKDPIAPAHAGARTMVLVHLGNLAYWNGKGYKWDPNRWRFVDDAEANRKWLDRERRSPWQLPKI